MNNPKSVMLGWGSLLVAAGISFYFTKKTINERRREHPAVGTRPTEILDGNARVPGASGVEGAEKAASNTPNAPASGSEGVLKSIQSNGGTGGGVS